MIFFSFCFLAFYFAFLIDGCAKTETSISLSLSVSVERVVIGKIEISISV